MFKRTKICSGVLVALGGTAAMVSAPALAQVAERVEITGSRIRSLSADSPSPVQVMTAEDISKSGATNVQELLQKSPTFGTPTFSRTNSNFSTASAGISTVDLRSLGVERTLVLVNGRRFVSGLPGSTAVDLNTIPTDFIERIEIFTGGASATYGSDAVAGVVNIILKKSFEGFVIDASIGRAEEGDDKKERFSLTYGASGAGGKSSVMAHFAYSKQGAVYSKDREGGAVDSISTALLTGDWRDFFNTTTPFMSSFAPQGRVFYDTNGAAAGGARNRTFDRQGNIIPFSTNGPAGDGVGATGFNRQEFRTIAIPTERFLFASKGEVEYTPNHSAFIEGTYAASQTKTRLEPFPFDSADGTGGLYPASGVGPAEFRVSNQILANPNIPAALLAEMTDTDGDGLRDYSFTRRLAEVGNRGNVADRDTFRVVAGLKGGFGSTWEYDGYLAYGATKESQVSSGQVNVLNFRNAMEAIPDVNDVDGDGNTTEAICIDAQARTQGCVPANVFGFGTLSPAALRYITAPGMLSTFTTQKFFGGTVRGEPFNLPAGPVGVAVGLEYREEFSRSEFDPLQQAGLNAGNAIPRTEGKYDVKEVFVEARLPLLKNFPGAESLTLSGAVRGSDYSTVGSTLSWNTALEWAPVRDVRLRATQALSTRAPNINELFSPPSQTFPTGLTDPCIGVTATSTSAASAGCRAAPGVNANIAANGSFTLNQADIQGISGFDRGNPNLREEEGESTTVGLVYSPSGIPALRNFTFTADWFRIKVKDAIVATPRGFILDQCYTGDASFCQFITRRPAAVGANSPGSISFIDSAVTNSGDLFTEGFDLTVGYNGNVGPGRLNTKVAYTRTSKGYITPLPGSARDEFAGEIGGIAKDKVLLTLGYNWGAFGISTMTTYLGKMSLDDQLLKDFNSDPNDPNSPTLTAGSVKVPSKTYTDLQLSYTYNKARFYLGVDNLFYTKGPNIDANITGVTGATTQADVYDNIGRRYYVGVRMEF